MKLLKTIACTVASCCLTGAQAAVTQVEGQAGGGVVPWGLLSAGSPTVSATWVDTGDYTLSSVALQTSMANWLELSYARITFDTGRHPSHDGIILNTDRIATFDPDKEWLLGKVDVDVIGAKVKLLEMSDSTPAVALGVQYKETNVTKIFLDAMGAEDNGLDFYLAATKVMPIGADRKLLLNATVRATKGNQIGILGFESKWEDDYEAEFETSIGVFLNDQTVVGLEYRMKPDNIKGLREDDWGNLFFAYFPSNNLAIVAAYAEFGDIAGVGHGAAGGNNFGLDQRGLYLQVQGNF